MAVAEDGAGPEYNEEVYHGSHGDAGDAACRPWDGRAPAEPFVARAPPGLEGSSSPWPHALPWPIEQTLPCHPGFLAPGMPPMMDPWLHWGAYIAGWQAANANSCRALNDKSSQKTQRRREPCKPQAVPPSLGPALEKSMVNDLVKDLEAGGANRKAAVERVTTDFEGQFLRMSFDKEGCWLVQSMLVHADSETAQKMHEELGPHVRDMARSPHANYVVTKMIEVAPIASVGLIISYLRSYAEQLSRHRYGNRIICRLLQRSSREQKENPGSPELPGLPGLVDEVLLKAPTLCCHIFAHHVIQSVLENSLDDAHRHRIFQALNADVHCCAQDRHASFILQAALKCCCSKDVDSLGCSLIDLLPQVATTGFGSYVYHALCKQPSTQEKAIEALIQSAPMLKESTQAKKLMKWVKEEGLTSSNGEQRLAVHEDK
jgi:hypothetical protein